MDSQRSQQSDTDNSDNHDKFCWKCHQKVNIRTICRSCCRSVHRYCVDAGTGPWTCSVCIRLKEVHGMNVDRQSRMRFLAPLMKHVLENPKFKMLAYMDCWKTAQEGRNKIINPVDLSRINERIESHGYGSLDEFLVDLEWLYHNCYVYFSANHKFTLTALELLNYCSGECALMKSCIKCYKNKMEDGKDWMKRPCNQPHLIVWINIKQIGFWPSDKGYSYWPAKLLAVADDQHVSVVFFGYHELFRVPSNVCQLYSSQNPDPLHWMTNPREIAVAIDEMEAYIKSICKMFGVFANAIMEEMPLKTPFTSQSVGEHLEMIFPGLGNRIQLHDDSMHEVSKDITLGQYDGDNSPATLLAMPKDRLTPDLSVALGSSRPFGTRKSSFFPSNSMFESAMPGKRYKRCEDSSFATSSPIPICDEANVAICKENFDKCISSFADVFDHMFEFNMKLEQQLKGLNLKHSIEIRAMEDENAHLAAQVARLTKEMKDELDVMEKTYYMKVHDLNEEHEQTIIRSVEESEKQFGRRLKAAKEKQDKEIAALKARYDKKIAEEEVERRRIFMESYELIEQKNEEFEAAKKELKREFTALIEDAKGKKFCIACGIGKPLDLYYVCDTNCQQKYCGQKYKK